MTEKKTQKSTEGTLQICSSLETANLCVFTMCLKNIPWIQLEPQTTITINKNKIQINQKNSITFKENNLEEQNCEEEIEK